MMAELAFFLVLWFYAGPEVEVAEYDCSTWECVQEVLAEGEVEGAALFRVQVYDTRPTELREAHQTPFKPGLDYFFRQ